LYRLSAPEELNFPHAESSSDDETMAISVVMPALEMAQETGKLLAWRKKEGERTVKGEPLLEIETDKAVVEVEATADGILAGVKSREGDVVPVGAVIAWIVQAGEAVPEESSASSNAVPGARAVTAVGNPLSTQAATTTGVTAPAATPAQKISPKARRLAKEQGIDISLIKPTGPDATITTEDVLAYTAAPPAQSAPAVAASASEPLSQIARLMAERTTQSWTTVPHFFVQRDLDATAVVALQKKSAGETEQSLATRPSINDVLVALVSRALVKHPLLNAAWTGDNIRLNPAINISIAMAVRDGVVGAVINNADKTSLAEIAKQRRELSDRARAGKLRPADISGGTFTISNLGMFDVDSFTAIITPPQVAILAVGKIVDRVVAVNGLPVVRPILSLNLSSDHRVVDGARAAEFLNTLASAILNPGGSLA
jgi:pyruvate dehydrogenase E2 component (dihydrolipoamide acetyltransferase)